MIVSVPSTGQCRSGQVRPTRKAADGYPSQQSTVRTRQLRPNGLFKSHICSFLYNFQCL